MRARRIYISSSGDAWDLQRDDVTERLFVLHTPNLSSGGQPSRAEIGDFLSRNTHSAEHAALLRLIGTLIEGADPSAP